MSNGISTRNGERLFHFSDERSHKFWSVSVQGETQTVRWGRIATDGQTQSKTFASAADAATATERLIAAKQKKGYVEVAPEAAEQAAARKIVRRSSPAAQLPLPLWPDAAAEDVPPSRAPTEPASLFSSW